MTNPLYTNISYKEVASRCNRETIACTHLEAVRESFQIASRLLHSIEYLSKVTDRDDNNLTEDILVLQSAIRELTRTRVMLELERYRRNM